jgi:hypothetical protein
MGKKLHFPPDRYRHYHGNVTDHDRHHSNVTDRDRDTMGTSQTGISPFSPKTIIADSTFVEMNF